MTGYAPSVRTCVIITKSGENADFLAGSNCFLITDREPKNIADKVKYLTDNPELMKKMGENGRKFIEEQFNWELYAEKYKAIIEKYLL